MTEDVGAWDFFVGESVAVSLDVVGDSVAILFGALVGILVFFPFFFVLVGAPVMSEGEGEGREDTESDGVLVMEEVGREDTESDGGLVMEEVGREDTESDGGLVMEEVGVGVGASLVT